MRAPLDSDTSCTRVAGECGCSERGVRYYRAKHRLTGVVGSKGKETAGPSPEGGGSESCCSGLEGRVRPPGCLRAPLSPKQSTLPESRRSRKVPANWGMLFSNR